MAVCITTLMASLAAAALEGKADVMSTPIYLSLAICLCLCPLLSLSLAFTHTLTITCTCCYDMINGIQDLKIYSHADSHSCSVCHSCSVSGSGTGVADAVTV